MRVNVALLVLLSSDGWAALGTRQAVPRRRVASIPLNGRRAACQKLCSKHAEDGSEERECLVDCRVRTDLAHAHGERALRNFADRQLGADEEVEAYNEMLGGETCKPLVDAEEIEFKDMDLDGDSIVVPSEIVTVGSLLCIPGGLLRQLFADMDYNSDGQIEHSEWQKAGEDTTYEYEVDRAADLSTNKSETFGTTARNAASRAAEELLAEVRAPDFEVLDTDGDGFLDEWEVISGCMRELIQRDPTMPRDLRRRMLEFFRGMMARMLTILDSDGDGRISPSEYEAAKVGHDLGDEVKEIGQRLGLIQQEHSLRHALQRAGRQRGPADVRPLLGHLRRLHREARRDAK